MVEPAERTNALEPVIRRLLALIGGLTGLESTYLTAIDWDAGEQEILVARNAGTLHIPEGVRFDWAGTLCRRALDGGPSYTCSVPEDYPEVEAAAALGLQTYVTVAVNAPDGSTFGTLCGASAAAVEVGPDARAVMETLAEMISLYLERDEATARLQVANAELERLSTTDFLTGLGNRRRFQEALEFMAAVAQRRGEFLAVGLLDIDGFKAINDMYGHDVGDAALVHAARVLEGQARIGDVAARWGGDEFAIVMVDRSATAARQVTERTIELLATQPFARQQGVDLFVAVSAGSASNDGTDVEHLLRQADLALYEAKRARGIGATAGSRLASPR